MKDLVKAQKSKTKKLKHQKDVIEDNFKVDTSDPRFSSLYMNPDFAIDTTDKLFKKTQGMEQVLSSTREKRLEIAKEKENEVRRKKEEKRHAALNKTTTPVETEVEKDKASIASLVSSLKMKTPKFEYTSKNPMLENKKSKK